jgi:hypothetical protein
MPRVQGEGLARAAWYDRTAETKTVSFLLNAAPHGVTERINYTVSAGKRARVGYILLSMQRVTAASPVGNYGWSLYLTPNGAAQQPLDVFLVSDNTARPTPTRLVLPEFDLVAGDNITIKTSDGSTGGLVYWAFVVQVTEYDA